MRFRTITSLAAVLVVAGAGRLFIVRAADAPPANVPPPTGIRVINVAKVFSSLLAEKNSQGELTAMNDKLEVEKHKLEEDLANLQKELKEFKQNTDPYNEALDNILRKSAMLQGFPQFEQTKMMLELRLRTAKVYRDINKAVEEYSKANGVGLVLATDEPRLEEAHDQQELLSQMAVRKVIYAHDSLDITNAIIQKMNAEFQAPAAK